VATVRPPGDTEEGGMGETAAKFFDDLAQRGHEPRLAKVRGTIRFEQTGNGKSKPWLVTIDRGDVTVTQGHREADAVVRADEELIERLLTGEANALTALLRGAVQVEGSPELLVFFQRLLPGPAS
jgi:putative sterol carrier protein